MLLISGKVGLRLIPQSRIDPASRDLRQASKPGRARSDVRCLTPITLSQVQCQDIADCTVRICEHFFLCFPSLRAHGFQQEAQGASPQRNSHHQRRERDQEDQAAGMSSSFLLLRVLIWLVCAMMRVATACWRCGRVLLLRGSSLKGRGRRRRRELRDGLKCRAWAASCSPTTQKHLRHQPLATRHLLHLICREHAR